MVVRATFLKFQSRHVLPLLHSFPVSLTSAGRDLLSKLRSSLVLFSLRVCMWRSADVCPLGCAVRPAWPSSLWRCSPFLSLQEAPSCLFLGASVPAHSFLWPQETAVLISVTRSRNLGTFESKRNCCWEAVCKVFWAGRWCGFPPLCIRSELSWPQGLGIPSAPYWFFRPHCLLSHSDFVRVPSTFRPHWIFLW